MLIAGGVGERDAHEKQVAERETNRPLKRNGDLNRRRRSDGKRNRIITPESTIAYVARVGGTLRFPGGPVRFCVIGRGGRTEE